MSFAADHTIARPELTMPYAEAALVRDAYGRADVILEYGSGGSTVLASEMTGKTVFSVESDQQWAAMMRDFLRQNPPASGTEVDVIWADIGPTKEWGHPADNSEWKRYPRYPLEIWYENHFKQPDVVLVDGRFRAGCALATAFMTEKPVELLFDDYIDRKAYHVVEEFLGAPQITGRMAKFNVTPQAIDKKSLMRVVQVMSRPL